MAVEGCTGWRYVVEEITAAGFEAHLAEPADTQGAHNPGSRRNPGSSITGGVAGETTRYHAPITRRTSFTFVPPTLHVRQTCRASHHADGLLQRGQDRDDDGAAATSSLISWLGDGLTHVARDTAVTQEVENRCEMLRTSERGNPC